MSRKLHRILALLAALPFLVVVVSGCLLQVKSWIPFIHPESEKSPIGELGRMESPISWERLLGSLQGARGEKISSWKDIKAIDVRPQLGVARARTISGYEVQVDLASGEILSEAMRYSSILLQIHDGVFFGKWTRSLIFIPTAFMMLVITISGIWILMGYYGRKWGRKWKNNKLLGISALGWKPNM